MHGSSARPAPQHRAKPPLPIAVTLGLTVVGVLGVLGASAAFLPESLTGSGASAGSPVADVALAPGAGGGAPGVTAAPSHTPSRTATPAPKAPRTPKATPKVTSKAPVPKKTTATTKAATPKATTTRTTAALAGSGQDDQEDEVIRLVNVERDKAGCGSVKLNTKLRTAIRLHAAEVGEHAFPYLSHVSDDGRDFVTRAKEQGYTAAGGENIARGQRDAGSVMDGWMKSDGHRANILNCSFKAIGVARVQAADGSLVWGQLFGRS